MVELVGIITNVVGTLCSILPLAAPKNAADSLIFEALHLRFLMVSWWTYKSKYSLQTSRRQKFGQRSCQLQISFRPQRPRSTTMSLAPTTL
jgi:hypothetical protein